MLSAAVLCACGPAAGDGSGANQTGGEGSTRADAGGDDGPSATTLGTSTASTSTGVDPGDGTQASGGSSSSGGETALCLERKPLPELFDRPRIHARSVSDGVPWLWLAEDVWDPLSELRTVSLRAWSVDDEGGMTERTSQSVVGAYRRFIDVDGDGRDDLAVSDWMQDDAEFWLRAAADGTFADTPLPLAWPGAVIGWRDANRDGFTDLFTALYPEEQLALYLGDGQGGFTLAGTLALAQGFPRSITPVSGHDDLIVATAEDGGLGLGGNDSIDLVRVATDGSMTSAAQWDGDELGTFRVLLAEDRVGDDGADLLLKGTGINESGLWMLENDGPAFVATNIGEMVNDALLGDFDGSGERSLLVTNPETSQLELWRGANVLRDDVVVLEGTLEDGDRFFAAGDFDGDGTDELILSNTFNAWSWAFVQVVPCG